MVRTIRCISIGFLISCLGGCLIQEDAGLKSNSPTNEVSSVADADLTLDDGGLVAPSAPTLSISSSAGALNFKWVDWRTNVNQITSTKLFEYNTRTEQETELEINIEPGDLKFTVPVTPHRMAWDAISYRVEICTVGNCVSSLRVPVSTLLSGSATGITPANENLSLSFGDDLAINDAGNVAVVSSPKVSGAAVFLYSDQRWIQASTLESEYFARASESGMRVSISASGDTVAIASMSTATNPVIVIFDRLGENWIETALISPFKPQAITEQWDTTFLNLKLSDNGDRIAFTAKPRQVTVNKVDERFNQLLIFDRSTITWTRVANLAIPLQHRVLSSFDTSDNIDSVVALSTSNDTLYVHEFLNINGQWREQSQPVDAIYPGTDTKIVSSHDATQIGLAAWEPQSQIQRSATAWKLEKRASGWIAVDSIRMPPTADPTATLKLASDAQLHSLVMGWQAQADANLAFYAVKDQRWQHLFSLPEGLNVNQSVPLAQSIAISADNSTVLLGIADTGNGGVVNAFR